jgi:transposase
MLIDTPNHETDIDFDAYSLPPTFPLVLPICRQLGIIDIVNRFCPMKDGDHLTHGQVAEFLILHILQSPDRLPLYRLEHWAQDHNVHELYGRQASDFNDDRTGRTLDAISDSIADIETAVVTQALHEFDIDCQAIHWDLTHITFSGAHEDADMICKGYGAGKVHERQLQVSFHVTNDGGIPLRHEALKGNAHQAPLAHDMLKDLQQRLPRSDLIMISDRAGISYDNINVYRSNGAYFLGPLRVSAKEHVQALAAAPLSDFRPLSYRSMKQPDDAYSYYPATLTINPRKRAEPILVAALFIHSQRLQQQQASKRQRDIAKALAKLEKVPGYLNRGRYAKADYAREQIKKKITEPLKLIVRYDLSGQDLGLALRFWTDENALADAAKTDGRYVLVHDLPEHKQPDDIFCLYRDQHIVEKRNRNFHSDLSVRPVWLQKQNRIQGLLLIYAIALVVYTLLERCSERAGLDTEHYHKMTAHEMLCVFAHVRLKDLWVGGENISRELTLSHDQRYVLDQLGFPDPSTYLKAHPRPPPDT